MSDSKDSDQQHEKDMLSMFASVWVKVEVEDENEEQDENENNSEDSLVVQPVNNEKKKTPTTNRNKKTLKCESCEYTTIYRNCLNLHILGHTNSKPFSCKTCDYTTKYPNSLQRHMMIQHDMKVQDKLESFSCDECPYTTYFKWNLKAHKRKHKLEKQYKCDHCNYATAYRHNYIKHGKVHDKQEVIYRCDKCPFVTKYEGHISRHLAKIHHEVSEKANRCDFCDFSTKVRWRLNVHKRRSKQKDMIKCSSCEFQTIYMCESKKHKVIHYKDVPDYKLNESSGEITFDAPEYEPPQNPVVRNMDDANLSIHEKSNNYMLDPDCEIDWKSIRVIDSKCKDRPYQCIMCKYTSRFKASVQRHFQRHHTGSENRPYKCVNCDFSTKTKDQIALHNKRSQSEAELLCRDCPYTTFFKCQFVTHQKCHYPHKCTECNYSCKHKYEIEKHVYTMHMGNGLKCRFCDFTASRKESLLCHETIHTGTKPYKCNYCDYTSVRKSLLDNHVKRYHSDICHNPVIVSDSKIESLKIPIGNKVSSSDVIQNIREQNISLEDILDSPDVKDFAAIMHTPQNTNNGVL